MTSCHNDPDKTKAAQHPGHPNWTATGDLSYVDSEGFLFLTDRRAFTIISRGVNIYPQEIEDMFTLHPKIFDIAVIGVPAPEMREQVEAVVQVAAGVEAGPELEQELPSYVRERLAHYNAPKSVDFVTSLPRTATGKLQKRKIPDHYLPPRGDPCLTPASATPPATAWRSSPTAGTQLAHRSEGAADARNG